MTRHPSRPAPYSTTEHIRPINSLSLPRQKLPEGLYLVHNLGPVPDRVRKSFVGDGGFRAWVQRGKKDPTRVKCPCKFGWIKNHDVQEHYVPEAWSA
jgi:hypothetical protein